MLKSTIRKVLRGLPDPLKDAVRAVVRHRKRRALRGLVGRVEPWAGGFGRKSILEVGSDASGVFLQALARANEGGLTVGINPEFESRSFASTCRREAVDVRNMPYPDGTFDVAVSIGTFEHIHDLDVALDELHRVLRPGGTLVSIVGPIWSAVCGHHLWLVHDGKEFNYWNTLLPPYAHLLMDEDELRSWCVGNQGTRDAAEAITEFVFRSEEQNRLFFDDYVAFVELGPFTPLVLKGGDNPALSRLYDTPQLPVAIDELRRRDPGRYLHYGYVNIEMVLRRAS